MGTGKVRVDAVALTDAFEFPDNALNSAVGRHDGNVCVGRRPQGPLIEYPEYPEHPEHPPCSTGAVAVVRSSLNRL